MHHAQGIVQSLSNTQRPQQQAIGLASPLPLFSKWDSDNMVFHCLAATCLWNQLWKQLELPSRESLVECPIHGSHVIGGDHATIACCDLKRVCLTIHVGVALPILTPIARHHLPTSFRPFNGEQHCTSSTSNIGYQHKVEQWLHQPPALLGRALFGGQKFVVVTIMEHGRHHLLSITHLTSKYTPQVSTLSNRAVLNAAMFMP
ncbi:hypothetical protein GQ457_02G029010 [Hibiscus cannabinus]